MTKRMLALVLIFCLILPVLPADVFAAEPAVVETGKCGENATYTFTDDGVLTISGTGATEDLDWGTPWDGGVADQVKEVVVEPGITRIGERLFHENDNLQKVTLPEGLESIGEYAFGNCDSLTAVVLPDTVTVIEADAFNTCLILAEVKLPKGLKEIGEKAFAYTSLSQVDIPEGTTTIGDGAFYMCEELTSVTIPNSVTEIGAEAFCACYSLKQIQLPEGLKEIKNVTFGSTGLEEITIPESVESIGEYAFYNCKDLKKITILNPDATFGEHVFKDTPNLTIACLADTIISFAAESAGIPVEILPEDYTGPKYNVTISSTGYGTAEVNTTEARPGRYVKVTVNFDDPLLVAGVVVMPEKQIAEQIEMINLSDTELLFKMPECNVQVGVAIEDLSPFEDVSYGKYYYEPVLWAYINEITTGKTETQFAPNDPCIRKQVVTFLWRACGCPEPWSMENPFTDVAPGSFYEKPILWAYHAGITTGKTSTTFAPDDPCTRDQIVTFLWRTFGCPEPQSMDNPFTDVGVGSFFEKPILWAYYEGITTGKTATTFEPKATCTRCQIVTFLYRSIVEE